MRPGSWQARNEPAAQSEYHDDFGFLRTADKPEDRCGRDRDTDPHPLGSGAGCIVGRETRLRREAISSNDETGPPPD